MGVYTTLFSTKNINILCILAIHLCDNGTLIMINYTFKILGFTCKCVE